MELNIEKQNALIALLERAYQAQTAWVADLTDDERAIAGSADRWSPKDTLAHIVFWQQVSAERLQKAQHDQQPADTRDFQPINEQIFEQRRALPWEHMTELAAQTHADTTDLVRTVDHGVLTDANRFAWNDNRPLVSSIISNNVWHPLEHICQFYVERGQPERADAIQQTYIIDEPALAAFPHDKATAFYNLACFHALGNRAEEAMALLPEAFQLRPDLIEWSKQDSDLDSLRDLPAFQSLTNA